MNKHFIHIIAAAAIITGCAQSVNPDSFAPVNAPVSSYKPSQKEMNSKNHILVVPFNDGHYKIDQTATNKLKNLLAEDTAVKLIGRKYTSLDKEIALAEEAKKADTDLNEADYILQGKITSLTTKSVYRPEKKIKNYTYKKPYYENSACIRGEITVTKIPENYILKTVPFQNCEKSETPNQISNFDTMLNTAVENSLNGLKETFYNLFAKKGYIFEIRKKDGTTILHTTLGSNTGAKEGIEVYIYTIKETKLPYSDKTKKEEIKIGTGTISKTINPDNCWVTVNETSQPVKINDFVKPHYEKSFFNKLVNKATDLINNISKEIQ